MGLPNMTEQKNDLPGKTWWDGQ